MLACVTPNCFTGLLGKLARGSQKAQGSNLPLCRYSSISLRENGHTTFAFVFVGDSHEHTKDENIVIKWWQGVPETSGFGLNTELSCCRLHFGHLHLCTC